MRASTLRAQLQAVIDCVLTLPHARRAWPLPCMDIAVHLTVLGHAGRFPGAHMHHVGDTSSRKAMPVAQTPKSDSPIEQLPRVLLEPSAPAADPIGELLRFDRRPCTSCQRVPSRGIRTAADTTRNRMASWSEFTLALPIAAATIFLIVLLQRVGLLNIVNTSTYSYGTAFAVGVVASLSSCMAVVGGLSLGLSASFAKTGDRLKPQVMFHAGRMIAYFILGGVIGSLGKAFTLSPGATFAIEIFVAVVLFILGLNLLEVFAWTRRLQPSLPQFLAQHAVRALALRRSLTPFVVGAATFFLPCGFTQSIQIYALSTGSFLRGGLTMLTFALGTFPVLALASFGSSQMGRGSWAGGFFKSVGLVVIAFSLFSLVNCLVLMGIIPPVFNS